VLVVGGELTVPTSGVAFLGFVFPGPERLPIQSQAW